MRILIFNWRDLKHPLAGGAEVYTDCVAREWVKMGHSVTLFCAEVEGEPEREMSANGYLVVRKGSRHSVYREAKRFWKKEGEGRFDIVIDEVNTRPFFCNSFVRNGRVVVLIHQVAREIWFYESSLILAFIGRYILEPWWLFRLRTSDVVAVSESTRESLEAYGIISARVVPEGQSTVEIAPAAKESQPTVVFLGRLTANKRVDHAIRAFSIVQQNIPNAQMWVIGDGYERQKLEGKSSENVYFFGRVSQNEKYKRLSSAHLLVVTSVREGWGLVVTEAAALGTIAVSYASPGLRDSVRIHGGILVEPGNITELARQMTVLLSKGQTLPEARFDIPECPRPWEDVASQILEWVDV